MNKDTNGTRINRDASRYRYAKKVESGPGEKIHPPRNHTDTFPLSHVFPCKPPSESGSHLHTLSQP